MSGLFSARRGLELKHAVGASGDELRRKQRQRRQHHDHQRNDPVNAEHEKECAEDGHDAGKKLCKAHQKAVCKLVGVCDDAADQLAARMRVEIRQRQDLHFFKRIAPHIAHHAEGDAVIEIAHQPLQQRCDPGDCRHAAEQRHDLRMRHCARPEDAVDGVSHKDGHIERSGNRRSGQHDRCRQHVPAFFEIPQNAAKRFHGRVLHCYASSFLNCDSWISR